MDLKGVIIFEVAGHSLKLTEALWQKEITEACNACDGWKNRRFKHLSWGFVSESSAEYPVCLCFQQSLRVGRVLRSVSPPFRGRKNLQLPASFPNQKFWTHFFSTHLAESRSLGFVSPVWLCVDAVMFSCFYLGHRIHTVTTKYLDLTSKLRWNYSKSHLLGASCVTRAGITCLLAWPVPLKPTFHALTNISRCSYCRKIGPSHESTN
jgi:hypothetical protein